MAWFTWRPRDLFPIFHVFLNISGLNFADPCMFGSHILTWKLYPDMKKSCLSHGSHRLMQFHVHGQTCPESDKKLGATAEAVNRYHYPSFFVTTLILYNMVIKFDGVMSMSKIAENANSFLIFISILYAWWIKHFVCVTWLVLVYFMTNHLISIGLCLVLKTCEIELGTFILVSFIHYNRLNWEFYRKDLIIIHCGQESLLSGLLLTNPLLTMYE